MISEIQAVFLDRDGTLGGDTSVIYPGEFKLFYFSEEAIRLLKNENIKILGFTNQPGISKGKATKSDFEKELLNFGLTKAYICPHSENGKCNCRKPEPGMLFKAEEEFKLNLAHCVVIGDRWSDMIAAKKAGAIKVLVMTGAGKKDLEKYRDQLSEVEPNYIAENLLDAVKWVLNH